MTREELLAELELEKVALQAGRTQLEDIKPGMSNEAWTKAAADILLALKEGE